MPQAPQGTLTTCSRPGLISRGGMQRTPCTRTHMPLLPCGRTHVQLAHAVPPGLPLAQLLSWEPAGRRGSGLGPEPSWLPGRGGAGALAPMPPAREGKPGGAGWDADSWPGRGGAWGCDNSLQKCSAPDEEGGVRAQGQGAAHAVGGGGTPVCLAGGSNSARVAAGGGKALPGMHAHARLPHARTLTHTPPSLHVPTRNPPACLHTHTHTPHMHAHTVPPCMHTHMQPPTCMQTSMQAHYPPSTRAHARAHTHTPAQALFATFLPAPPSRPGQRLVGNGVTQGLQRLPRARETSRAHAPPRAVLTPAP